ncbi:hypothetical protein AWENTII_007239 [Aspergillus wentii]
MDQNIHRNQLFSVDGLVAVITGGGTGIGRMMAHALALNGAQKVYILGRRTDQLDSCASASPSIIRPIECDVTSKSSLEDAADIVMSEVGYINFLACNAGTGGPRSFTLPSTGASITEFAKAQWEVDMDEYVDTFRVNTAAVWYTAMAFLELLDAGNKKGNVSWSSQIVATSSVAAFNRATPGNWAYAQSKAGVTHMMKQLATGLVPYGIRANSIAPGVFPSELSAAMVARGPPSREQFPAERFGDEEDMSGVILFMASRAGAYMNGNVVLVDGGSLSVMPATY